MRFPFTLPTPPWSVAAIASAMQTPRDLWERHLHIHHQGYIDTLNAALASRPDLQSIPLPTLLTVLPFGSLWNAASQHFLHTLFWESLTPDPTPLTFSTAAVLRNSFKSQNELIESAVSVAQPLFGSGWLWLVAEGNHWAWKAMPNADLPPQTRKPRVLAVIDLWEHAFLPPYAGQRAAWIRQCVMHLNWEQIAQRPSSPR